MTPEREKHLLLQVDTIESPEEMTGFIKGLKLSLEFTTTIMQACRSHAKDRGWE